MTNSSSASVVLSVQGILFDMDGVLVSSLGSVERSWTRWAEARGVDVALTFRTMHGRRAIDTVRMLRPDFDSEVELKAIEELEVNDNDGLEVLPGVEKLLTSLPANRWTIVTSATGRLARVRLQHGGLNVPERFIYADLVKNGKPHPEPYLRGAELLGVAASDCVVFEDAPSGVAAARAAGCTVIGTTFSHTAQEMAEAHYLVEDVTGVRATDTPAGLQIQFAPLPR